MVVKGQGWLNLMLAVEMLACFKKRYQPASQPLRSFCRSETQEGFPFKRRVVCSHLLRASCLFGWMVEWCCAGEVPFEAQLGSEFSAPGTFVVGLGIPLFETWEARLCHRSAFQVGIPAIFAPMKFRWNTRSMILAKTQRLKRTPLGFFWRNDISMPFANLDSQKLIFDAAVFFTLPFFGTESGF